MADVQTPRFEVTALGETMLRFSVPVGQPLEEAQQLAVHPGGAESNVCAALAALGRRCGWVSCLTDNPLGELILHRLRAANIDTSAVVRTDQARVGTYYLELAAAPRETRVVYDRAHSALAKLTPSEVDWTYLLDTRLMHLTGITPALSRSARALVEAALERALEAGVAVSFDVNYRRKLWSAPEAARCLTTLIGRVDILICGKRDAAELFDLKGDSQQVLAGLQSLTSAKHIVLTQGEAGAAALDGKHFLNKTTFLARVVDRVGAGDAFTAGVIDGCLDGSLDEGLRRGVALSALAVSQRGDMLVTSREQMEGIQQSLSGHIQR